MKILRKILSLLIALFPARVAGAAAQDQATTLFGFPPLPSFRLGEVPNNSTQDPQCNIDSSTVVLGRPTVFFPFALASKACLKVFSN